MPLDTDEWQALRADCSRHKLNGLLVHAVACGDLGATPTQRAEVASLEIELTRARIWHEEHLVDFDGVFTSAGIETRVLKGPALARLDYPDVQMRPTGDLDLLVRGSELDRASELLVSLGGRRTDPDPRPGYGELVGKGATIAMPGGLEIDLHRILVWGPLGVRTPDADLWRAERTFVVGGRVLSTLPLEESLLHACYHLLVLGWRRALTLRDVAQLVRAPDLDTDRLLALARRWRAEIVLATAIGMVTSELRIDLPVALSSWSTRLHPSWWDQLCLRIERSEDPIGYLEPFATYRDLPTRQARSMLARATLQPAPGTWPSPPHRLGHLLRRMRR